MELTQADVAFIVQQGNVQEAKRVVHFHSTYMRHGRPRCCKIRAKGGEASMKYRDQFSDEVAAF